MQPCDNDEEQDVDDEEVRADALGISSRSLLLKSLRPVSPVALHRPSYLEKGKIDHERSSARLIVDSIVSHAARMECADRMLANAGLRANRVCLPCFSAGAVSHCQSVVQHLLIHNSVLPPSPPTWRLQGLAGAL